MDTQTKLQLLAEHMREDEGSIAVCAHLNDGLVSVTWDELLALCDSSVQLVCPTCGFPVEEINRNGLYIAARCGWCNEVVHIAKE